MTRKHLKHYRSSTIVNNKPQLPTAQDLEHGEIAMNYADGYEVLAIKNSSNDIVTFSSVNYLSQLFATQQWVQDNFSRKPVVIWETDGTTGLLGVNDSAMNLNSWQLENLDFTPYKFVMAYFKQADRDLSTLQSNYVTPAMRIPIPLDEASKSSYGYEAYLGGGVATNPNDRNVLFCILVAIDGTKTKFKVLSEHSIYGTALGGRNDNGRYCYKLEGYYD